MASEGPFHNTQNKTNFALTKEPHIYFIAVQQDLEDAQQNQGHSVAEDATLQKQNLATVVELYGMGK